MLTEIAAGWASLKAAREVVQALNGMENATLVNDVKLTLQRHLLDAQDSLFAAQTAQAAVASRISDLEQEIARLQGWENERDNYKLTEIGRGVFAYVPGDALFNTHIPHWLCANCFGDRKKSILQNKGPAANSNYNIYHCPICRTDVTVHLRWYPFAPAQYMGWEPGDD